MILVATENVENNQEASENTEATEEGEFPVTVTDATGDELTFDDKAEKIVSVLPSNTEIAFALGLEDEIVGVTELDNYPEEAQEKETVGDFEINVEKVISLERSEELTSELQSRGHLVCRLLPATTVIYTLSLHDALPIY